VPDAFVRHPPRDGEDALLGLGQDEVVDRDVGRPHLLRIGAVGERAYDVALGDDAGRSIGSRDERHADVELREHRGERTQGQPLVDGDRSPRHDFMNGVPGIRHGSVLHAATMRP